MDATAREYRRLSKDRGGHSIAEQGRDSAQAAAEHGWTLGPAYEDPDRSASRYRTKERDGFDQLIADLKSDRFAAQVLVLWESSRGSRDVGEWDALIKLAERRRVKIHVTSHGRTYDPSNHRDRRTLLEDAVDSAYESDKSSVRIRRTTAAQAAAGRPHGLAPYGFTPVYDPATGALDTWTENPAEADVPRELFRLLAAGHTLAAITRDFAGRSWTRRDGRPFSRHHLRNMATRVAYAGIRQHCDPETGKVTEVDGTWDALVPPEQFYAVRRILADQTRRCARNGKAVHVLSMTLRCDFCGGPLTVTRANLRSHRESYSCRASHVFISKPAVDAEVIPALLAYLSRPDIHAALAAPDPDDERTAKVRADLAQARAAKAELEAEVPESATHTRLLARSIDAMAGKIDALEAEERGLAVPPVLAGAIAADDVAVWWAAAPLSARREIARLVLSPSLLGEVRVTPTPVAGRTPDVAARLVWRRA